MTRSILVVEDYPDLRTAIAQVLSRNDCVCECVDSDDAITLLRTKRYQAILISPRLPIASDPVLHYMIENQPSELEHVVVMTSAGPDDETPDSRYHVLAKPFSREELMAQIRAAK